MNAPKLRFPEFSQEWNSAKGGDAFNSRRTKGEDGIPIYSVTLDRGMIRRDTLERQILDDAADGANLRAQQGDLVYNMMRMWQGAVGLAPEDCMVSPAYVVLAPMAETSSEFFNHWFKSKRMIYLLWAYSQGITSDRLRLYFKDFAQIPLHLPSFAEQTKIANFLTAVDEKISQLTQKYDLLTQYKKGVMQQIFNQELRFKDDDGSNFPEWENVLLGKLGTFQGGGTPNTSVAEYWNGDIPWISSSDLNENSIHDLKISRKINSNAINKSATKQISCNSILIVSRVGVGKLVVSTTKVCTSQDFSNFTPSRGNVFYIAYWLSFWKKKLVALSQGTSILGFTNADLKLLKVNFPCIEEQTKIANFLTAIDEKITQTQAQLAAAKQYKQGLLQQMFV